MNFKFGRCTAHNPYPGDELPKLRLHAGDDLLIFLLHRHMGFRGSDAVKLTWKEVRFDCGEIERVTQKRKKNVVVPIGAELSLRWSAIREARSAPQDVVLLNPEPERECCSIDFTCGSLRSRRGQE